MKRSTIAVSPAQAKWIVERLIADRRISLSDVRDVVAEIEHEITDIERRLSKLRSAASATPPASPAPRRAARTRKTGKRQAGGAKGHPRGIAGTLVVLLRSLPAAEHAAINAIRAHQGIKPAILAAREAIKQT